MILFKSDLNIGYAYTYFEDFLLAGFVCSVGNGKEGRDSRNGEWES